VRLQPDAVDLRKLDSDRRLLLAGISHDLRTPLTRLRIAVEMLSEHTDRTIAAGIVHDIEDMDSILRQFLDYARDGSEEQPSIGDFNAVVDDVCRRHAKDGASIKVDLGSVPSFAFRALAIRRAVANLVDNAVRYGATMCGWRHALSAQPRFSSFRTTAQAVSMSQRTSSSRLSGRRLPFRIRRRPRPDHRRQGRAPFTTEPYGWRTAPAEGLLVSITLPLAPGPRKTPPLPSKDKS